MNGKQILHDITWTVNEGENWAILGPNGAGKTTLLKMVCGYLWPNRGGEIYRNGEAHADLGTLRRSIGWVTSTLVADVPLQEIAVHTVLSGKYAQFGLWAFPWEQPGAEDMETAHQWLDELGCTDLARRPFGALSQGEQQKVLICRALMAKPYLMVLDEPCAGMDPGAREIFLSALLSLGTRNKIPALVYVTHHVEEILPVFNMTLGLKEGRIVMQGPSNETLTSQSMGQLYDISLDLVKKNGRYWMISA